MKTFAIFVDLLHILSPKLVISCFSFNMCCCFILVSKEQSASRTNMGLSMNDYNCNLLSWRLIATQTWKLDFLSFRTPPIVPARKHSRAGCLPDRPPQRPPKPGGSRRHSDDNRSISDASPTIEDDIKKENTEWYEYGCVWTLEKRQFLKNQCVYAKVDC